jgi:hypothetical protein
MEQAEQDGQAAQGIGAGRVQIEFVETPIRVSVDMALLTWGDLLVVQRLQRQAKAGGDDDDGAEAERALNALVSKITGQDAVGLPAVVVTRVLDAIKERTAGLAPKN